MPLTAKRTTAATSTKSGTGKKPVPCWEPMPFMAVLFATGTATFMWTPWKDMYAGFEYFYGRRENFNEQTGFDNRVNLVLRYMFNR